jgi:hypothetical protein
VQKESEKKSIQMFLKNKLLTNKIGISIGNSCHSATWAVINGIRCKKQDGYATCVFDLMISNYDGVVKCIAEDFTNFTNPAYLINQNECIFNTYYNFCFNHEGPGHANLYIKEDWPEGIMHFVNNNYAHFIERYNNRIDNFRNYLSDPDNYIYFIFDSIDEKRSFDNFNELEDALKKSYPNLSYEIIKIR